MRVALPSGTEIRYCPLASVVVPRCVPLTTTLTPGSTSPLSSLMVPVMVRSALTRAGIDRVFMEGSVNEVLSTVFLRRRMRLPTTSYEMRSGLSSSSSTLESLPFATLTDIFWSARMLLVLYTNLTSVCFSSRFRIFQISTDSIFSVTSLFRIS